GIDERRIHIITAGRDAALHVGKTFENYSDGEKRSFSRKKTALYIGWPTRVRGIELLLDAYAIAARQAKNLYLKILARGEDTADRRRLHRLVSEHPGRDRISIIEGFLPREDVFDHIRASDFGVLPFIQVPADRPLSFLEFFELGKPVISTDASGIPDLIGGNRGIIANRVNPESLAGAMLKMAGMDVEDYKKYQDACLIFADEYPAWDDVVVQLASILNEN
ncbi:MAG: glycosyltransferase family 4 protein, partial [Deltaproteobacteria bacterium]|nr:glycosyltransferase family 4 protein [Deltaproteobacteria bacterium]